MPGECAPMPMGQVGSWEVPGNEAYRPVYWPDLGCSVGVAKDPAEGAPPLRWCPCSSTFEGDFPGCEMMRATWNYDYVAATFSSVVPWGQGYRIAVVYYLPQHELAAIYDTDGTAIAAWRIPHTEAVCQLLVPQLTPSRVWLGVSVNGDATRVAPTWDALTTVSEPLPEVPRHQFWHADEDLLVAWLLDGTTFQLIDLSSGTAPSLGPGWAWPHAVNDHVVGLRYPQFDHGQVGVWSRQTGVAESVFVPNYPERAVDVNSDGQTMAWVVQTLDEPGWLWTSPIAATAAELQPVKRRSVPFLTLQRSGSSNGFYAVFSRKFANAPEPNGDGNVHLYRLADAHHWQFAPPGGMAIHQILHIDDEYIFYQPTLTLVRQRMDALGPGDPVPAMP